MEKSSELVVADIALEGRARVAGFGVLGCRGRRRSDRRRLLSGDSRVGRVGDDVVLATPGEGLGERRALHGRLATLLHIADDLAGRGCAAVDTRLSVLARVELEDGQVAVGERGKEVEEETGFRENVEDAVPHHLRVVADDVCTLAARPADGVKGVHEGDPHGRYGGNDVVVASKDLGALARRHDEDPPHVKHRHTCKGVVAPLVRRLDEGTDKQVRPDKPTGKRQDDNVGQGQSRGERDFDQEEREGENPVDVLWRLSEAIFVTCTHAAPPDLTPSPGHGVVAKLCASDRPPEVGCLGEVRERGKGEDHLRGAGQLYSHRPLNCSGRQTSTHNSNLVEKTLATGDTEHPRHKAQVKHNEDAEYRPEPV